MLASISQVFACNLVALSRLVCIAIRAASRRTMQRFEIPPILALKIDSSSDVVTVDCTAVLYDHLHGQSDRVAGMQVPADVFGMVIDDAHDTWNFPAMHAAQGYISERFWYYL